MASHVPSVPLVIGPLPALMSVHGASPVADHSSQYWPEPTDPMILAGEQMQSWNVGLVIAAVGSSTRTIWMPPHPMGSPNSPEPSKTAIFRSARV